AEAPLAESPWLPWRSVAEEAEEAAASASEPAAFRTELLETPPIAEPMEPLEPLATASPELAAPPAPAATGDDAAPDADAAEAETEESRERRRRSRRRGGRRRTGRGAAADTATEDEEEAEDDDETPEPAAIVPLPVPVQAPSRRSFGGEEIARRREPAFDYEGLTREIVVTMPERRNIEERKIALFCDLENVALGVRDSEIKKFDIDLVLERLLEKGKIIVKKAYADWERYSDYKRPFHEAAIELIDIPQKYYSGKNSADIKMVVDAMDLSYAKEHLDTFVLLSGDSDFSPLVSKLKENNKYVIGIGVKNSSSALLIDNCDEFIFYEDVWR